MISEIDIERLIADAEKSCCNECYLVLHKNNAIRIGAGARIECGNPTFYLDISITLCSGTPTLDTEVLDKGIKLARHLKEIGYHQECMDGEINCDKNVSRDRMNSEYSAIKHLINELGI